MSPEARRGVTDSDEMMCKVSVIIPVYNAERYIERCVRSLFEQTLESIEYIFVDDRSPDDSIAVVQRVLSDYPRRRGQVRFLTMPVNSRQAAARAAGLAAAKGDYILHCDPDDWVDHDYYRRLYECAVAGDHDLVTGDVVFHFADRDRIDVIADFASPMEVLRGDSFYSFALFNQLIRADLIHEHDIRFYPGVNYMEDFGFNARVYCLAKSAGHVHGVYYHYNKTNDEAITRKINEPEIVAQRIECLNNLNTFFSSRGIDVKELGLIQRTKRDVKDLFLTGSSLDEWVALFPEVCGWVAARKDAPAPYRMAYRLSHHVGTWPMRLYLGLRRMAGR